MKIEINRSKIHKNASCRHEAYDEKCLPCMYGFAIYYQNEIKKIGLDEQIKKVKSGGGFLWKLRKEERGKE